MSAYQTEPAPAEESLGQVAYRAYGRRVGWKNYRGGVMPLWPDLPRLIQAAWEAAAQAVADKRDEAW